MARAKSSSSTAWLYIAPCGLTCWSFLDDVNAESAPDLVGQVGLHLVRRKFHVPPSEPDKVRVAGVGADGDAVRLGQRHRVAHPGRVAGVEPAGDVRRADVLDDLLVEAHLVHPEALAHVAVQIDLGGHRRTLVVRHSVASRRGDIILTRDRGGKETRRRR